MDHGIWATWYDLEGGDKDKFIAWLHGEHLPMLQRQPGHAWVAHYENTGGGDHMKEIGAGMLRADEEIGNGSQYLMLVGAPSPQTFLNPNIVEAEKKLPQQARDMLALRKGVRTAIFAEEARVTGPAVGTRAQGTTPAPAIQMGSFRVRTIAEEFDLGCWYAQYRLPYMAQMPGSVSSRKLMCVAGWAKHAVMYEFVSLEARMQNFELPHESLGRDPKEWTGRIARYTIHTPGSPTVGRRIWPPVQ